MPYLVLCHELEWINLSVIYKGILDTLRIVPYLGLMWQKLRFSAILPEHFQAHVFPDLNRSVLHQDSHSLSSFYIFLYYRWAQLN